MRRALLALALASMTLVAGCSLGPAGTPTASPDASDTLATPDAGDLPAGVDSSGLTNATALREAHLEAIRGSSFRMDVSEGGAPDPVSFVLRNGTSTASVDVANPTRNESVEFYIGGDVITRFNASQAPPKVYSYGATSEQFGATFLYAILLGVYPGQQLTAGTFEVDGIVTRDGEELIRLSATGINETAVERQGSTSSGNLSDMSGHVWVRPDGLVRRMSLNQSYDSGTTTSVAFEVSGIGRTSPEEPDWLGDAPRLEGSLSADGDVLALTHAGGATIPAGTTLTLQQGGFLTRTLGNVTLPDAVSGGDTVYLHATGTPANTTVEVTVGGEPAPSDPVDLSQLSPQVSGTLDDVRFVVGVPRNASRQPAV